MSRNCQLEIQYSNRINKRILYIVLEKPEIKKLPNGMGVLLSEYLCFNAYDQEWNDDTTKRLKQAIDNLQNEIKT